ncbi:hypothetical protein J2T38_001721 [Neisseria perflava]|uniref:hypothetical protein n=1 Tax=Neisseria perflava TaxID=33053 RepID=UPI00209DB9AC|nr:hypothetical protein [Neisseria perflava]MCP1772885.1 hypothetical protein [Neisseria perflava]
MIHKEYALEIRVTVDDEGCYGADITDCQSEMILGLQPYFKSPLRAVREVLMVAAKSDLHRMLPKAEV